MEYLNPPCVMCKSLATLHPNLVAYIFFTLSPDPNKFDFHAIDPDLQKQIFDKRLRKGFRDICKYPEVLSYSIHYELNQAGNLHAHGIIHVPLAIAGYSIWLSRFSKIFNNYLGRKGIPSNISSKFEWLVDVINAEKYVNKENVYSPIHHIVKPTIELEDYLISDV